MCLSVNVYYTNNSTVEREGKSLTKVKRSKKFQESTLKK